MEILFGNMLPTRIWEDLADLSVRYNISNELWQDSRLWLTFCPEGKSHEVPVAFLSVLQCAALGWVDPHQ